LGREPDVAEHRIVAIDRFQIDQRELAALRARHGAHHRRDRDLAMRVEKGALAAGGFALDQRK
jgi:hypothetical protein